MTCPAAAGKVANSSNNGVIRFMTVSCMTYFQN
ncbi:hypothetical protein E4630_03915 [Aeromonas hydrophila]|nr:hypothetical protein C2U40_17825 [Aeromonas sp. ASNIH4]POU38285.1 hypothetical protein C3405_14010 [Aeromonas hydrophila]POV88084.1 hypothetical protein C3395_13555 [Aeromonas sp. ASNIH6]QBX70079.1 hypothetical protein E4625_03915 [Aeromonas hydrophila]QBX74810.1 hypothetical protein E4630_03915 [Aeromonas hydrophila]